MPVEMVLHYDHRVASLTGRVVVFKADEPRMVADEVVDECIAIGAKRTDGKPKAPPPKPQPNVQPSGVARADAIKETLAKLKLKNNANDFAGTGRPKVDAVSRDVGFKVDAQEVTKLWDEMNADGTGNE